MVTGLRYVPGSVGDNTGFQPASNVIVLCRGVHGSRTVRLVGDGGVGSRIRGGHLEEVRLVFSELSGRAERKWTYHRIPFS